MSQFIPISLAGQNATGYVIDFQTAGGGLPSVGPNKCGYVEVSVNGSSGDFWVAPFYTSDAPQALPSAPADPRPSAGTTAGWVQVKSGETYTFGTRNSKGYDPAVHPVTVRSGQLPYFAGLLVYCVTAGTVSATQLRVKGE